MSELIKKILAPTDFSEGADAAVQISFNAV